MKKQYRILDLHCDTLTGPGDDLNHTDGMLDFEKMEQGGYIGQVFAIFFPDPKGMSEDDLTFFLRHREKLNRALQMHADKIAFARNGAEVLANRDRGKTSALLSIEDARMLDCPALLDTRLNLLTDSGVTIVGLCWNRPNALGYPAADPATMYCPLTDFGMDAVDEMARRSMLIDVSHLSDGGFFCVAGRVKSPFLATHSGCRALADHPRNLSDPMLRALAEHGGIAGVNFYPPFVAKDCHPTLDRMADHILHMIAVGGEDLPALGSDFDGFSEKSAPESADRMPDLIETLQKRGLTPRQIDKIACGNALRVLG